jgi:hypothetical protein
MRLYCRGCSQDALKEKQKAAQHVETIDERPGSMQQRAE